MNFFTKIDLGGISLMCEQLSLHAGRRASSDENLFDMNAIMNSVPPSGNSNFHALINNAFGKPSSWQDRASSSFVPERQPLVANYKCMKRENFDLLHSHLSMSYLHGYVDSNTELFFPPLSNNPAGTDKPNKLQKALLLKAWLNFQMGNIEEAHMGLIDAIRFGQANQDDATVNFSLMFLSSIAKINEDFLTEHEVYRSFFSSKIESKNPVLVYFVCLAKLDLDKKTSVTSNVD
jgi:hypothetical protein